MTAIFPGTPCPLARKLVSRLVDFHRRSVLLPQRCNNNGTIRNRELWVCRLPETSFHFVRYRSNYSWFFSNLRIRLIHLGEAERGVRDTCRWLGWERGRLSEFSGESHATRGSRLQLALARIFHTDPLGIRRTIAATRDNDGSRRNGKPPPRIETKDASRRFDGRKAEKVVFSGGRIGRGSTGSWLQGGPWPNTVSSGV